MPPGPKKRKAAKKKMEKETNTSTTNSHGDDDLKFHDEKESDGGKTGSPTSQDHHNKQHDGEEEEMEKREDASVQSIGAENEPLVGLKGNGENTQKTEMEGNSVIQIDWVLDPEDDSDRKNGGEECIEYMKESHRGHKHQDGGTSISSSSSSSDDESHVVEKNIVVIGSVESNLDPPCLVEEKTAFADPVKTTDLPHVTQLTDDVPIMDAHNLSVEEANDPIASKEDTGYLVVETATSAGPVKTADVPEVTQVTDGVPGTDAYNLAVGESKAEAYDPVAENASPVNLVDTADLTEVTQLADSLPDIEAYNLVVEEPSNVGVNTVPPVEPENVSKDVVHVNYSMLYSSDSELGLKENGNNDGSGISPIVTDTGSQLVNERAAMEIPMCSSDFEFGLKENGENESSGVSPIVMDTGSQPKEDKASPTIVGNSEVTQVTDSVPDAEDSSLIAKEPSNSLVETIPLVNSENVSKEVVHANDSTAVENPKRSGDSESGLKEHGENESSGVLAVVRDTGSQLVNDNASLENPMCPSDFEFGLMENEKIGSSGVSPVVMDTESQPKEAKLSPTAVEYHAVSSVAIGSAPKEDEERLLLSSSVPLLENSHGGGNVKDYAVTERSDRQPLVVSGPRPVQKTFWNSCCGLFELFTGSSG